MGSYGGHPVSVDPTQNSPPPPGYSPRYVIVIERREFNIKPESGSGSPYPTLNKSTQTPKTQDRRSF